MNAQKNIHFAGKSSFVPTPTKDKTEIVALFNQIKNSCFDELKGIALKNNIDKPRLRIRNFNNPLGLIIEFSYENIDNDIPKNLDQKFKRLKKIFGKYMKKISKIAFAKNLDGGYHATLTGGYRYIAFRLYLSGGYYVCPLCLEQSKYFPDRQSHIPETPLSTTELCGEKVVYCPNSYLHGDLYFTESKLTADMKRCKGEKTKVTERYTLHKVLKTSGMQKRILHELQMRARLEEPSFRFMSFHEDTSVYLLLKNHKPVGYIIWNDCKGIRVMRQLFVLKEHRGGAGSLLMQESIMLETKGKYFYVETPNEISSCILEKLGYSYSNEPPSEEQTHKTYGVIICG